MAFCFGGSMEKAICKRASKFTTSGSGMLSIRHNPGLLISGILHILIMVIPVSMVVVQKFGEIELFVMDEEVPVVQDHKIVHKQKKIELLEVPKQEVKGEEPVQKIEEKPVIKEEIIEPRIISNKPESITLPLSEKPNPLYAEVREVASALQVSLPPKQTSQIQDVELGSPEGPKFLHRELPTYPTIARRIGKEGKVILRLTIDEKGNLLNVEIIENVGYGFTEAAIEAVKRSTFLPAKRGGKSVASRATLPIRFVLRRD